MQAEQDTIPASELRHLLRQAAAETMVATAEYCMSCDAAEQAGSIRLAPLEETLAWIAVRVTQRGWELVPADAVEARAPIAWAVQEIVEWVEHLVRLEARGDDDCRVPLTWLPRATHPLVIRDVSAVAQERADLLREELAECGALTTAVVDVEGSHGPRRCRSPPVEPA